MMKPISDTNIQTMIMNIVGLNPNADPLVISKELGCRFIHLQNQIYASFLDEGAYFYAMIKWSTT